MARKVPRNFWLTQQTFAPAIINQLASFSLFSLSLLNSRQSIKIKVKSKRYCICLFVFIPVDRTIKSHFDVILCVVHCQCFALVIKSTANVTTFGRIDECYVLIMSFSVCQLKITHRFDVFTNQFEFSKAGLVRSSTATNKIHVQVFQKRYKAIRYEALKIKAHKSHKRKNDRYHECITQLWRLKRFVSVFFFCFALCILFSRIYLFVFFLSLTIIIKYFYNNKCVRVRYFWL